jgi:hypothetical protein
VNRPAARAGRGTRSTGASSTDDFEVTIDPAKGRTEYGFRDRGRDERWLRRHDEDEPGQVSNL